MLLYTAEMKLEMDVSMAKKRERVEDLLQQLALEGCRNVRIGSNMQRGISGKIIFMSAADLVIDTTGLCMFKPYWTPQRLGKGHMHYYDLTVGPPPRPCLSFLQEPGK